ncbi:S-type pyocin [Pseudomonas urethralis]|uniref:S-type pyocin n=1 Tax=Pseudomonas urethralis TaxID=2740517 RepID=UPI003530F553
MISISLQERNADMAFQLPEHIANKLAEQTFENFDDFSHAFWLAIAEDPIYSQQFVTSQLNRIKQGWPPRAPFGETAKGVRNYQICHLDPPAFGGAMYDAENMRIMSALQYALSSEVKW